ncbi:MAG TPA: ChuX/HutX family heme-like substrate-binding protein [Candidatus Methylacidiphilales bacterium]
MSFRPFHDADGGADRPLPGNEPARSPLLRPELKRNLWFPSDGGIALRLSRRWRPMIAGLARLGPLLLASRNEAAILGHYGPYPAIPDGEGDRFFSGDGNFFFELLRWHHARVREQPYPGGPGYSVEFRNVDGNLFHKVCLTPESDFPAFLAWTAAHQAIGVEGIPVPVPDFSAFKGAPPEPPESPQGKEKKEEEGTCASDVAALYLALRHLMHAGLEVSVTLGGSGFGHTHAWRFAKVGLCDGWAYAADDRSVFHVRLASVAALDVAPRWWEPGEPLGVAALGARGETLFRLAPGPGQHPAEWNHLLKSSFRARL